MINSKYEMARITAANAILKLSGMLSENSTPELDKAKVRKANADAGLAEARLKQFDSGNENDLTINFIRSNRKENQNDKAD